MRGLALVALLGLMLLVVVVDLTGVAPWQDDSVEPRLTLPAVEAAVGDAVALPSGPAVAVADRAVVRGGVEPGRVARWDRGTEPAKTMLAVAPARTVSVADVPGVAPMEPKTESGAGDETPSVGTADGEAAPGGTPPPTTSKPPSGPVGPATAVVESCDGDEYVITVVLVPGEEEAREASVEIVLQRFNEDGSVEELTLEGDALDAENLALQLSSEGSCVVLEAEAATEHESDAPGGPAGAPAAGRDS